MAAFARPSSTGGVLSIDGALHHFRHDDNDVRVELTTAVEESAVRDRFERTVVPLLLSLRGWTVLHASSVIRHGQAVVFMAPSMTGKSTTAYALTRHGFQQTGDDAAVIELINGHPHLWPIPFRSRLREHSRRELGDPAPSGPAAEGPIPIRAILELERGDRSDPEISTMSNAAAVQSVLANLVAFDVREAEARAENVRRVTDLVASGTPIQRLALPGSIDRLEDVGEVLDRLIRHDP